MTRGRRRSRTYDSTTAERLSGMLAWFDGDCARCERPIQRLVSQIMRRPNGYIHVGCASGATDE